MKGDILCVNTTDQTPHLTILMETMNTLGNILNIKIVYTLLSWYKWKDSSKTKNRPKAGTRGGEPPAKLT